VTVNSFSGSGPADPEVKWEECHEQGVWLCKSVSMTFVKRRLLLRGEPSPRYLSLGSRNGVEYYCIEILRPGKVERALLAVLAHVYRVATST
jgi:hypothetical protein